MYNPTSFAEDRIEVLHSFIRRNPLATIVTAGSDRLEASHVPVILHADQGCKGVLRFHLARANNHWKHFESQTDVLVIFQGPEHYVSPSWYPSKQDHGKVVPTWNYVAVHVRGPAKLLDGREELILHLHALTDQSESAYEEPWSVADAPKEYIEGLCKAIVGVEVVIETVEGKWKASQNRSETEREGVVSGLHAIGSAASHEMAQIVACPRRR